MSADVIMVDGYVCKLEQVLSAGRAVAAMPSLRASRELKISAVLRTYRGVEGEITASRERLDELARTQRRPS